MSGTSTTLPVSVYVYVSLLSTVVVVVGGCGGGGDVVVADRNATATALEFF